MIEWVVSLGKLLIGFLGMLGPVVLWLMFLSRRDRRLDRLSAMVLRELSAPELRGLFAVKIRSNPFSGEVVAIDLWNGSQDQLWELLQRLSAQLPSHVRVEINGIRDSRTTSGWTFTAKRNPSALACCSG